MGRVMQKLLALILAVGLIAGSPVCACAQMIPCGSAALHETRDVPSYAELNVDPGGDTSLQAELPSDVPHHDDSLCKKVCATCVGASLPSTIPGALAVPIVSSQMALMLDDHLVEHAVPTEPGIPKPH